MSAGYRSPSPTEPTRPAVRAVRRRSSAAVGLVVSALLLTVGCTTEAEPEPAPPPPFADCAALTASPVGAPTTAGAAPTGSSAPTADAARLPDGTTPATLPALELPCFTGGETFPLTTLRGPAVVNLWGSWCHPCRKELPVLQRLAERAGDRVHVVGVVTRDSRDSAQSLAEALQLTFPNLFDPDERLRRALGRPFVPMTLLVDEQGRIRHLDATGALDDAELADLLARHLGVVVSS